MFNNHISNNTIHPNTGNPQKKEVGDMNQFNLEIKPGLNQQLNKLDPLILNPETATFKDIEIHAETEQYLSKNTIKKRIRYLKYMENHEYPVNLKKADKTNFIRHIRYRLYYENPPGTIDAIKHEKLAFNMLRKAYGQDEITLKLPRKQPNKKMILPLPDTVRQFWHYNYYPKREHTRLFQYIMRMSYLIGMRTPSELANLREHDIIFNNNGTAILTIHEDKENNRERTIVLDQNIATDPRQKSLLNWMNHWRPRLINENCDAIFPKRNGDYWTPPNLGKYMRLNGKKVWEHYHPYVSRHWSCVARLIEQKETTNHWNTLAVKEWHGHDKIKNTEKYIKYARQYYQIDRTNWIQRVLKAPYKKGCGENPLDQQTPEIPLFRVESLREQRMGEATRKLVNRRTFVQQIPKITSCWFNYSFSFSFYVESLPFDMSEDQNTFFIRLPPYNNNCSCFVPYSSLISTPFYQSNSIENYFFIVHNPISVDYMMDQHNPVGCICNDGSDVFFEEYVDLSFPQFLDSIYPNIIKLELFNYGKQVLQNCYMLHEKKCEGGCNSFLPITYKVYGDCDSN